MDSDNSKPVPPYAKGLACLLVVAGALLAVSGIAVIYGSFAFPEVEAGESSIARFAIGVGGLITSGLTLNLGIVTLLAPKRPKLRKSSHTLALVDAVASVLALLCCSAVGSGLPTSLILNLALSLIWMAAMRPTRA